MKNFFRCTMYNPAGTPRCFFRDAEKFSRGFGNCPVGDDSPCNVTEAFEHARLVQAEREQARHKGGIRTYAEAAARDQLRQRKLAAAPQGSERLKQLAAAQTRQRMLEARSNAMAA